MPWYAWAYLLLLALIGAGGFAAARRDGTPPWMAALRLATFVVLGYGVVAFHRADLGAGLGFAALLFVSVLLHAQKAAADAAQLRVRQLPAAARVGVALGSLALLPAIALGALAVWIRQGA